jgi:hypothetical protein
MNNVKWNYSKIVVRRGRRIRSEGGTGGKTGIEKNVMKERMQYLCILLKRGA